MKHLIVLSMLFAAGCTTVTRSVESPQSAIAEVQTHVCPEPEAAPDTTDADYAALMQYAGPDPDALQEQAWRESYVRLTEAVQRHCIETGLCRGMRIPDEASFIFGLREQRAYRRATAAGN